MTNNNYISFADLGTDFYVSGSLNVVHFESSDYDGWFLVMENGVLNAGLPNNGSHEFMIFRPTPIHNILRQGGCDIAFNSNGIPEPHCTSDFVYAALITISIKNF